MPVGDGPAGLAEESQLPGFHTYSLGTCIFLVAPGQAVVGLGLEYEVVVFVVVTTHGGNEAQATMLFQLGKLNMGAVRGWLITTHDNTARNRALLCIRLPVRDPRTAVALAATARVRFILQFVAFGGVGYCIGHNFYSGICAHALGICGGGWLKIKRSHYPSPCLDEPDTQHECYLDGLYQASDVVS